MLLHACGYNLCLLMRHLTGVGTPCALQGQGLGLGATVIARVAAPETVVGRLLGACRGIFERIRPNQSRNCAILA